MKWPQVALGEVASIDRTSVLASNIKSGTRYVGLENITGSGVFQDVSEVEPGELASNKFSFCSCHVLYGKLRPYLRKIARPNFSGICSTDILPISASERLDKSYLFHFLRLDSSVAFANSRTSGANLPRISPRALEELCIPLPSIEEQRRIAAILDQAEAIRTKRQQAMSNLQAIRAALFNEAFNECLDYAPLSSVSDVASGVTKSDSQRANLPNTVPYIRVANVQAGFLQLSEVKTIKASDQEIERLQLKPGDILMTEGGDFDKLGRGAIWDGELQCCIHQNHVFRVRMNKSRLLPEVFHYFLQTDSAKKYFLKCAKKTSNLASINMTQLRNLPTLIPPMEKQRRFVKEIRAIATLGHKMTRSQSSEDHLFLSLQHRAFRGEL